MTYPRIAHASFVLNGKLYVAGGIDGKAGPVQRAPGPARSTTIAPLGAWWVQYKQLSNRGKHADSEQCSRKYISCTRWMHPCSPLIKQREAAGFS